MPDREIVVSEEHECFLKTVLQLDERRKVPQPALELYDEIRTSLRRVGAGITEREIAMIPVLMNRVARPGPKTFLDEIQEHGEVKYGTRVVAKFRGKWHAGRFIQMNNKQVVVVLDDDTAEERKLGLTSVRIATREDLELLGEKPEEETE